MQGIIWNGSYNTLVQLKDKTDAMELEDTNIHTLAVVHKHKVAAEISTIPIIWLMPCFLMLPLFLTSTATKPIIRRKTCSFNLND